MLALIAADVNNFENKAVKKFIDGHIFGGTEFKNTNDEDVVRATMIATWQIARRTHDNEFNTATASQTQAQPPAATATIPSTNVPNSLPYGIWSTQVKKYNQIQIVNKNRSLPENQLVGADKVLARVHHEHTAPKNFTPIQLGNILTTRSFTATGEIDKLALKDKDKTR